MTRLALTSIAYSGRGLIASGQEQVNVYAEVNEGDPEAPVQISYYPTPGSILFASPNFLKKARGSYETSTGVGYYIVGQNVYVLTTINTLIFIGAIADRQSQIYFSDNGLVCVFVDGVNGYVIDLPTNTLNIIVDPNFYGADFVVLLDTFFIFNRPLTNQFYISASNASYGMLTNTAIATGTIVGGAAYTNGVYQNVSLTGGSGTGATANITITGAAVTAVDIADPGQNYLVGDVLSALAANIGGTGAGFTFTITKMLSAFDPLDIAAKSGFNDPIVGIATVHRELALIGNRTTEIWIGTGAADFFFQEVQGAYINHGCAAQYSIATQDILAFFIMQDQQGNGLVVMLQGYEVSEISTPRIVTEFKKYITLSDAIGMCFQIEEHAYYALIFPTANKGWLYDLTTSAKTGAKVWYEWNWTDINGGLNRPRANCCMFANGANLVGDWETGDLLKLDIDTYTDYASINASNAGVGGNGPIIRVRTFPHLIKNNNRITYNSFDADMEVGTAIEGDDPQIFLSWSDDKGKTYGNPVPQSMGKIGEYSVVPTWNRLGQARDRVFKLQWSTNNKTTLNGAFVEYKQART
jgi:hypothetical protein